LPGKTPPVGEIHGSLQIPLAYGKNHPCHGKLVGTGTEFVQCRKNRLGALEPVSPRRHQGDIEEKPGLTGSDIEH
jgi:hypothetical protein